MGTMYSAEAAPARNVNPPALKPVRLMSTWSKRRYIVGYFKTFLKNPVRWPEIWASNKHVKIHIGFFQVIAC